jgi:hypothetical protein
MPFAIDQRLQPETTLRVIRHNIEAFVVGGRREMPVDFGDLLLSHFAEEEPFGPALVAQLHASQTKLIIGLNVMQHVFSFSLLKDRSDPLPVRDRIAAKIENDRHSQPEELDDVRRKDASQPTGCGEVLAEIRNRIRDPREPFVLANECGGRLARDSARQRRFPGTCFSAHEMQNRHITLWREVRGAFATLKGRATSHLPTTPRRTLRRVDRRRRSTRRSRRR